MSSKRMLYIAVFGIAFIALFIGVMLLTSYLSRDPGGIALPDTETTAPPENETGNAARLGLIEVTNDNVQAVIATLTSERPESYTRELIVNSYWEDGMATYNIEAAVSGGVTSLKTSDGTSTRRAIVTPERLYVWDSGDTSPRIRELGTTDDWRRESNERQMLLTYEDVLKLPKSAITDAGYVEYGGEYCVFVVYSSGRLGYTTRCYISVALGLLTGAEEFDGSTTNAPLTYNLTTAACVIGEPDDAVFLLPGGEDTRTFSS